MDVQKIGHIWLFLKRGFYFSMLTFKIAFIDHTENGYTPNSLYTQALPLAQRNVLYLATALSTRGHEVTLFQAGCQQPQQQANLSIQPLPEDTSPYLSMDAVVHVNGLDALLPLSLASDEHPVNILWSFEHPQHISLLPLKDQRIHPHVDLLLFSNPAHKTRFIESYAFPAQHLQVFSVAMTRTLRKRFAHTQALADALPSELTLCFIQRPEKGLSETLDMFNILKQGFKHLQLKVLLPTEERPWSEQEKEILSRCEADAQIQVIQPLPRPAYVEQLIQSHVLCAPALMQTPTLYDLLDAIAAGCHGVSFADPALDALGKDVLSLIPAEPQKGQLARYTQALADLLKAWDTTPQDMIKNRFHAMAQMGTYFTWDLRVWEFESLVFQLKKFKALSKIKV